MDGIKALLSELNGVIAVSQIDNKNRDAVIELENNYEKGGVIEL